MNLADSNLKGERFKTAGLKGSSPFFFVILLTSVFIINNTRDVAITYTNLVTLSVM